MGITHAMVAGLSGNTRDSTAESGDKNKGDAGWQIPPAKEEASAAVKKDTCRDFVAILSRFCRDFVASARKSGARWEEGAIASRSLEN